MSRFKFISSKIIHFVLVVVVVASIYFFFSQPKVKSFTPVNYTFSMIDDFISDVVSIPNTFFSKLFKPDYGAVKINAEENMMDYKLQLVSKGLKNYFQSIFNNTNDILLSNPRKYNVLGVKQTASNKEIKELFKSYMSKDTNVLEVSFFNPMGRKMVGVKYSEVKDYDLSVYLLSIMKNKTNLLVDSSVGDELILISTVRQGKEIYGYVTQTLNPSFFVKILDFLNVGDENLFYLRTGDNRIVVDNFKAYSFVHKGKNKEALYHLYKELKASKEQSIQVSNDGIEYSVGMVVDKNNTFGNVLSFIVLILLVYLSVFLLSYIQNHFRSLIPFMNANKSTQKVTQNKLFFSERGFSFKKDKDEADDR